MEQPKLQVERRCPLLPPEDLEVVEKEAKKSSVNKYKIQFTKDKKKPPKKEVEDEQEKEQSILVSGKHSFYTCPTALFFTERGLVAFIDLINWSEDMHTPLVDGGLLNHTKYYFQLRQTVVGEQRLIEREEQERAREDQKNKQRNIKKGSKPGRSSKRTSRRRR